MATTSIWSVKGWLGKLVVYIENPEKTKNPKYFEKQNITDKESQSLSDVIDYAINTQKTQIKIDNEISSKREFISGVNCSPSTARDEMFAVKKRFGKNDGIVAFHGYQSFAPGEVTPDMAHEIGIKLAENLWGDRFQVIVATHLDKENHLHNHFVLNSVSFIDGLRYYRSEKDYYNMQKESDKLCREYGLSVIENPKHGKSKNYGEWRAEQENRPTYRSLVKEIIDRAIAESMTERQFFENLRKQGCDIKVGKDISVRPPGKERGLKLVRNFGEEYSIENIRLRILAQIHPPRQALPTQRKVIHSKLKGNFKNIKKITGFRALYFHYLYLLGYLPKKKQPPQNQIYFSYKEDIRYLNNIIQEAKLLHINRIDTQGQLLSYMTGLQNEIKTLSNNRQHLRYQSRSIRDDEKLSLVKEEISALSKKLGALRKEVKLCEDIERRSAEMKNKIQRASQEQNKTKKEVLHHDQFRRRS